MKPHNAHGSSNQHHATPKHALLRFFLYVSGLLLTLHVLLWLCVTPFWPPQKNIDTYSIDNPMSPIESTVLGGGVLREPGHHIALLGASSTRCAFPVGEIASLLPNYRIHNFTMNGANIEQCARGLALLTAAIPPEKRKDVVFVMGVCFLSFNQSDYGTWEISDPLKNVPLFFHKPAHFILRYFMVLRASWDALANFWYHRGSAESWEAKERKRFNELPLTDTDKCKFIKRKTPQLSPQEYYNGAFVVLQKMAQKASADGIRLVIVDLPMADWAQRNIPHDEFYENEFAKYHPQLKKLGIPVINMRFMNDEKAYFDWTHVRPAATKPFSTYLAETLRVQVLSQ